MKMRQIRQGEPLKAKRMVLSVVMHLEIERQRQPSKAIHIILRRWIGADQSFGRDLVLPVLIQIRLFPTKGQDMTWADTKHADADLTILAKET